jgi:DNA-binding NarL/FixJ family response regulator
MATVLLVDDHSAIVEHRALWLERMLPGLRVLEATTGVEGLAVARATAPDLVLLDLSLGDMNGFDLIEPLRAGPKPPGIVIFTGHDDDRTLRRVEKMAVAGLLWKPDIANEVIAVAVRTILEGGTYVSSSLSGWFNACRLVPVRGSARALPPRERIVVMKWDRLAAETITAAVRAVCPAAEVHPCHTAAEARRFLKENPADIGLFGLTLPDGDGLDFISEVRRERLAARILVVSCRRDERTRHHLRHAAIEGFYDCGTGTAAQLSEAIRVVAGGGRWFSPGALDTAFTARLKQPRLHVLLTLVELQVFAVLGDGTLDPAAAEKLGVSKNTLHTHRSAVMHKLNLHTRTELMNAARHYGLVRFTAEGLPLYPGFEQEFAERAARIKAKREKPRMI